MSRLALSLVLLSVPALARADAGAAFGESPRDAALGAATSARPGSASSVYSNPAGLADVRSPELALHTHGGAARFSFEGDGTARDPYRRTISAVSASFAARLPGPAWLERARVGFAVHVPTRYALSLDFPVREDTPFAPLYAGRAERLAVAGGLGVELGPRLRVGVGLTLAPSLRAPTHVRYDGSRVVNDADEGVVIDLDRTLALKASASVGLRAPILPRFALSLVYHQEIALRATGPNDTVAGGIVVDDPIDFTDYVHPHRIVAGAYVAPTHALSFSAGLVVDLWSGYRSPRNLPPSPEFRDTVGGRTSASWSAPIGLTIRAGYGFEPSPVPAQRGDTNLLDAHRHALSAGLGLDLMPLLGRRVILDVFFRAHVFHRQEASKELAALTDADPETPGAQIENFGYPSFSSRGRFLQGGIGFRFLFDGGGAE